MEENSAPSLKVSELQVTEDELFTFQAAHFSTAQVTNYAEQFFGPVDETVDDEYYEEANDDLGYYEDGVKRTLTDEQIAMFRHSEIQALLRTQRLAQEAKEFGGENEVSNSVAMELDMEQGEVEDDATSPKEAHTSNQARKGKKQKKKKKERGERGWFKENVKPDLRKRTWDMVDQGVASLEYEDEIVAEPSAKRNMQRKQISYDD